jgi:hypothetical protein
MSYRIVILVDVDADSAQGAYEKLFDAMGEVEASHDDMEWESSDEWYSPDGDAIRQNDITAARMTTFARKQL